MEAKGVLILGGIAAAIFFFFVIAAKGRRIREADSHSDTITQARTTITRAQQVVADFGKLIEHSPLGPTDIADEKHLPHPKGTLRAAILLLIRITKSKEQRGWLEVAALELAQYQSGVGSAPLKQFNSAALGKFTDDPERLANALLQDVDRERWEKFNERVEEERLKILRAIQQARPAQ